MALSPSDVTSSPQAITVDVLVDGVNVDAAITGITVSLGVSQANATCEIAFASRPMGPNSPNGAGELNSIVIWAGYNGNTLQLFGGEASASRWSLPRGFVLPGRDKLARLRYGWNRYDDTDEEWLARTYEGQDDAAIIRNLLEAYDISSTEANIESSGWTLGSIQPVVLNVSDVPWNLIQEIDSLAGYATFTTPAGTIYRRNILDRATTPDWTFEQGVDIISATRDRTLDGVQNRIVVRGLVYEGIQVEGIATGASGNFIPDPPGYYGEPITSTLIETDADALAVAERICRQRRLPREVVQIETIGNPFVQPDWTIQVLASDLELGDDLWFVVDSITHTITSSSFRTTVRAVQACPEGLS